MPKKIKFESFKYRFLVTARDFDESRYKLTKSDWYTFINSLIFSYEDGDCQISWQNSSPGKILVDLAAASFYIRGDSEKSISRQKNSGFTIGEDPIKIKNQIFFEDVVMKLIDEAGILSKPANKDLNSENRIEKERAFHDAWAESEDMENIDVKISNEVCTAPEMRYIVKRLGNIKGKSLLDVGCGLGEASVYFAMLGADVTSSDLSQGMLNATTKLANLNHVSVKQHLASAEDMQLSEGDKFDIIYAGNLLHHVNIEETLIRIKPHLKKGGIFVSWDPLAYNPAINVYRARATDVRTPDEHPLKWSDIKLFHKYFKNVETKYFWLTTLAIFVIMALAQRRNPNKERFWKVIIQEGDKWAWLYRPLEMVDGVLLKVFPPLRLLCWNVVIIAYGE